MDLIAERGIAAHYSGKVLVNGLVGHVISSGSSRGKTICLNNANVALRVQIIFSLIANASILCFFVPNFDTNLC